MGGRKVKYAHHLMDTLKFDETDLEMNEQGLFSDAQRQRFAKRRSVYVVSTVALAIITILMGLGLQHHLSTAELDRMFLGEVGSISLAEGGIELLFSHGIANLAEGGITLILFGGIFCYLFYLCFLGWYSAYRNGIEDRVACARDVVRLGIKEQSTEDGIRNTYVLNATGVEFRVDKPVYMAFKSGDPYCVYYTSNSKEILSVEKLDEPITESLPQTALLTTPALIFIGDISFTDVDLEENRQGRMSERQTVAFSQELPVFRFQISISMRLTIVLLVFIILFGSGAVLFFVFSFGIQLLDVGYSWIVQRKYRQSLRADIAERRVRQVEGRVCLSVNHGFTVQINDECFVVTKESFLGFTNGEPYRIYYARQTRQIVSIERL